MPFGAECTANFVGVTSYSNPSTPRQSILTEAKDYSLCLSYDSAQTYVKQTGAVVHGVPSAATATSITSLTPQNFTTNNTVTFTVTGAVPSASTYLAFSLSNTCSPVVGVTAVPLGAGTTVIMGAAISDANVYYVCYSTNNQGTYFAQTLISPSSVTNAEAGATSIHSISPSNFTTGSTPSLLVSDTISNTAKIAFVRNSDCSTGLLGQTNFTTNPANLGSPLTLAGVYRICYSTIGVYVLQQLST